VCILGTISYFQNYIARFGHGSAKLARQAKSKEKTLQRMVEGGLTSKVAADKVTFSSDFCVGQIDVVVDLVLL